MTNIATTPDQDLAQRQRVLEGEIQANEEENRVLQAELDEIYAEQDRRRA
jgi:hypothetical protein